MAPPPAKRQKRLVVLSSDEDEDDEFAIPAQAPNTEFRRTTTKLTSSNNTAKHSLPTRSRKPTESIAKGTRACTATQNTPDASPRKSSAKSNASVKSQASRPISTFFGAASQPQILNLQKKSKAPSKVEEEAEDLIEDDSPIEDVKELRGTQQKNNAVLDRRKRQCNETDDGPSGSQKFKLAGNIKKKGVDNPVSRNEVHSRPWAERFGPSNLEELMVHKRKVSDVRSWLDNALTGRSCKTILILRGPSGAGKTATISTLAQAMGLDLCEWKNPVGTEYSSEAYFSMAAQFEEFLGRSSRFGGLELSDSAGKLQSPEIPSSQDSNKRRKFILLEEFPNTFLSTSSGIGSFRFNILEYLATSTPSFAPLKSNTSNTDITPLIMVITETRLTSTTAASDSFTAHRLLGSDILNHPGVSIIDFNPMAATLLTKALDLVIKKEARQSGRRRIPSPSVLKQLGEVGDVRSAIGSLEFLCLRGNDNDDWGGRVASRATKGATTSSAMTKMERESLEMVTGRESSLGIFHAVGKVVYNKRDHPDPAQEALLQPPHYLPEHARHGVTQISVDRLIDETGTDIVTFIAALHENYVLSCEGTHFTDTVNGCLDALSDSDILGSSRRGTSSFGSKYGGQGAALDSMRQDEICFQLAVRGLLFSLPNPVKRRAHPIAGDAPGKSDSYKMFYPTSMRLARQMEEVNSLVDLWTNRLRYGGDMVDQPVRDRSHQFAGVGKARQRSTSPHEGAPRPFRTSLNCTKAELILERLPYIAKIEQQTTRSNQLKTITEFHGITAPGNDSSDDEDTNGIALAAAGIPDHQGESKSDSAAPLQPGIRQIGKEANTTILPVEEQVGKMYLSDDDIED